MVIVIDSVIITFVCVCGLILEHQWNCNLIAATCMNGFNVEYEKKNAWKICCFQYVV